jgi:outer membrane receptor protein involved in Fe transport
MHDRGQTLWRAHRGRVALMIFGLTVAASSLLSWAQDVRQASPGRTASEDASTFVFKELAVTATKTPRDPFTTPGEGNVVPGDEIERTQAQSLEDVLRYQPGIDVQNGPRRIGELPVIRGLTGPRGLTTVDGVRLNFQSAHRGRLFVEPDALKQIEVVRGPNSALWGSGALGGVVALTTPTTPILIWRPSSTTRYWISRKGVSATRNLRRLAMARSVPNDAIHRSSAWHPGISTA